MTPLRLQVINAHSSIYTFLILAGAANNADGHVDPDILARDVSHQHNRPASYVQPRTLLKKILFDLLVHRDAFVGIVLPAVSINPDSPVSKRPSIRMLIGNEGSLLPLIADFSGVLRGRQLRIAREVVECLGSFPVVESSQLTETESERDSFSEHEDDDGHLLVEVAPRLSPSATGLEGHKPQPRN